MRKIGFHVGCILAAVKDRPGRQQLIGWLLVFLGILLRARQYFFNRSLWVDEAMLALNIVNRGLLDLFKPLNYSQSPPLGFLCVEKLFITLFGNHDYILRLFPFVASVAAVLTMAWLSKRILPGWTGLAALGLFTFSWPAIYYASEVRPYGSDGLFTLLLLAAAYSCSGPQVSRRNWLWLLGAGLMAPWMSHPSLFIMAGIGIVLAIANLRWRKWPHLFWLLGSGLFWGLNFLCVYLLSLRQITGNKMLHIFFQKAFMPLPPWNDWNWFAISGRMLFNNLLHMPFGLGLAILAMGVIYLFRRSWKTAAQWSVPVLLALLASGLAKYPFWPRFVLFLLPILCFFLAAGMRALHDQATRYIPKIGFLISVSVMVMIFWQPIVFSVKKFVRPENKKDIKSLMAPLSDNGRTQDTIYVHNASKFQFTYYAGFYGINPKKTVFGTRAKDSAGPLYADIDKLAGCSRVWFLFANRYYKNRLDHEKSMLRYLKRKGIQKKRFGATGAALYLFDLSRH